jgi:hypothetical protein
LPEMELVYASLRGNKETCACLGQSMKNMNKYKKTIVELESIFKMGLKWESEMRS